MKTFPNFSNIFSFSNFYIFVLQEIQCTVLRYSKTVLTFLALLWIYLNISPFQECFESTSRTKRTNQIDLEVNTRNLYISYNAAYYRHKLLMYAQYLLLMFLCNKVIDIYLKKFNAFLVIIIMSIPSVLPHILDFIVKFIFQMYTRKQCQGRFQARNDFLGNMFAYQVLLIIYKSY